jgi:hypothetical protein
MPAFLKRRHRSFHAGGFLTDPEADGWSSAERALLEAALEFYSAAEAAIDYAGPERPHVRGDSATLQGVRRTMAELGGHVRHAHEAGVAADRIAAITRLEPEIVALILADARPDARVDVPDPLGGAERERDPAGS